MTTRLPTFLLPAALLLLGAGVSIAVPSGPDDAGPVAAAAAAPDGGAAPLESDEEEGAQELAGLRPPGPVPSRRSAPPINSLRSMPPRDDLVARARLDGTGKLMLPGKAGAPAQALTLDAALQHALLQVMKKYEVPYGAAVVVEPSTGRVLAMAEYSHAQPGLRGLSTRAVFPAASIFKVVTGAALAEEGLGPETTECFHGGKRRLSERLLEDSWRDSKCVSLATAMGKSANVVFAKLTQKHLTPEKLRNAAARFRFNRELTFPVPTDMSLAAIPDEPFDFAEAGAGFGDVYLSPLHGALIAAAAGNGGRWFDPVLFEGQELKEGEAILSPGVAGKLATMLEATVKEGTARSTFRERGFRVESAGGKTGTLADRSPFRDYSWFVGYAPADKPQVAVGAVIVNDPKWRIRATYLGREALRVGLERQRARQAVDAAATTAAP